MLLLISCSICGGDWSGIFLEIKKQNKTCLPNCSCLLFIRILPRQDLRHNTKKITGGKHTPEITFRRVNAKWYINLFVVQMSLKATILPYNKVACYKLCHVAPILVYYLHRFINAPKIIKIISSKAKFILRLQIFKISLDHSYSLILNESTRSLI